MTSPDAGSPAHPVAPAETPEESARSTGRGGMAVLGAKVFFLVTGFVQQPLLRVAVGLTDFGGLAQALVVANTVNNVVVASGTQGVSRIVSASPGHEDEALRAALRVHVPAALLIAGAMVAATPLYARFERADDMMAPLSIMALVACLYGLYAPLIGYLNGRRRFSKQAALDVTFAAMRTVGLVAFGRAFAMRGASGVLGTTVGWVVAAAFIVPLALRATGTGRGGPSAHAPSSRAYIAMLLPIAGAQLFTNALLQIDIALLGRFLSGSAASAVAPELQRESVKVWLAIYKECQTFAFLPYQLLFSVTLVLFPMLARARAVNDDAAVRAFVARGARLSAIFGGLLVGVLVAMPESLLSFAYGPADAARGADVLRVMALAQGAFSMLGIATTVLTSLGRERASAWITLGAVVAVGAACSLSVPGAAFGHAQLLRSVEATAGAMTLALALGTWVVIKRTGAFVPLATALRVALAVAVCLALGLVMPRVGRLAAPLLAVAVACAFLAMLLASGEVGKADLALARSMVKTRLPARKAP